MQLIVTLLPMHFYKTSSLAKKLYPDFIWDIKTAERELFLTFDDGPTPEVTQWVLEVLEEYNAKATFFCIGKNVEAYADIFAEIKKRDHRIGNHTFDHLKGWKTPTEDYLKNIAACERLVETDIFRPPYGKIKRKQAKLLQEKYSIVMWDILSYDFKIDLDTGRSIAAIKEHSRPGSIIVFHDSIKASKNLKIILPEVLRHFSALKYQFRAIAPTFAI